MREVPDFAVSPALAAALERAAAGHRHLCPRQVLGVRLALAAADALGLEVPRTDKRLLVIVETDGCFVSGVEAVTACRVAKRTLRVEDYGKVAVTLVDVESGRAVRAAPREGVRENAAAWVPEEKRRWYAQRRAYAEMPVIDLVCLTDVRLAVSVERLVSRPGVRARCERCGEEILNEREVSEAGTTLCRPCAGPGYLA